MPRSAHLRSLLDAFAPFDDAEAVHVDRMQQLIEAADDPFSRHHFEPGHFTASAFILAPDADELLLIHHSKLHRWLQPGGHVDPEDTDVLAAARREVAEEVALDDVTQVGKGIFDVDIHPIPARKDEPDHEHFDVRFLFRAPTRDFLAGSDANSGRWLALDAVTAELTDASVMRAVTKMRAG